MNKQREPGTAVDWSSSKSEVVHETPTHRVLVWQQSGSRIVIWTEDKNRTD